MLIAQLCWIDFIARQQNYTPMNAQLTEIIRLITNLIRNGTLTEVDREKWLCRLKVGELETNWIDWLTLRAGGVRRRRIPWTRRDGVPGRGLV